MVDGMSNERSSQEYRTWLERGAIAGDAGKGAAIGATVGTMRSGRAVRQGKKDAEQDYQQAQAQQQAAATDKQKIATFKKAFSVCAQGRGYSVQ